MEPFDLTGPLPTGTTLLEASAGTGKTYTVGALVTRYVAEGVADLDEMLVITFGRAASHELRERVRTQLVEAERALADPAGADRSTPLLAHLLDAAPAELAVRRGRLRDALASFDAATIATTHQFCQLVLRSLGVAGDTDAGARLVESLDELVVETVDDLYLQRFGGAKEKPPFGRDAALGLARAAVGDPQAVLAEADAPPSAAAKVRFATDVRREVERRKRRLGILSYDDLLSRLADALADEEAPARARMRQRWRIVLVDEFQDTDPVQWTVLDRAFSGHATMVLIGDPKQAIYGFRGGDVVTYLAAARQATHQATLGTNWRSDEGLVRSLLVPLSGAALGHGDIVVRPVEARHESGRLVGAPRPAPFRVRRVPRDAARFTLTRAGLVPSREARAFIADDCAADIAALLAAEPTWCDRPLTAGQVAVIVAIRDHGLLVQRALQARGVAAVLAGGGDVFLTPAGDEWLTLLAAMDAPQRSGLVRAAALTSFFGRTAAELDTQGEALTAQVADTLRGWALLLRGRGVAALVEAADERGLTPRLLGRTDGERLLTDLRHLGQVLHEIAVRDEMGLPALLEWFRDERRRTASSERPRRLDSDEAAVQIVTVHGSKGLEYPVTYLPFAYQLYQFPVDVARFHDAEGRRSLDVAGAGSQWNDHAQRHLDEELGEELRDLYVALTRAQSQVVTWWAPTTNTATGGLHRLLFGRQPGVAEVPPQIAPGDDDYAARILGLIEELGGPVTEVAEIADGAATVTADEAEALEVRVFDREVDVEWRRTSYSGLIRADEAPGVASEPEHTGLEDEAEPEEVLPGAVPADDEPLASPMADLPAGATFGSLVHAVLEHTDPDADDLEAELRRHVVDQLRWWYVAADPADIAASLLPVLHTPLGPLARDLTLAEVPLTDRLRELDFELPLAGGDLPEDGAGFARLRDVAPVLRRHLAADDPLLPYAERLEQPALGDQALRGYLSGSVDLVLRVPGPDGDTYVVADYKTNRLGTADLPGTVADYRPDLLADAMLHSHYPLQALLYSVVAHRYLRWRLADYDPERHLGGVLYLYLRGMAGPDTPVSGGSPAGVFSWRPPAALVLELSDLLDGVVA